MEELKSTFSPDTEYEIVIVGGGVSGASAAYHLINQANSVSSICILECGEVGGGSSQGSLIPLHAQLRPKTPESESMPIFPFAKVSGTAVLKDSKTCSIKMILNIFSCSSKDFISHHGEEGARSYLKLAKYGIDIQRRLSNEVNVPARSLGSIYVCLKEDVEDFKEEFNFLQKLGAKDIEFWDDVKKVQEVCGNSYHAAIYFPHDAIIDSLEYSRALIRSLPNSKVALFENCSRVVNTNTINGVGITTLADGTRIKSKSIIIATGGLYQDPALAGILTPIWGYIVGMQILEGSESLLPRLQEPNSPNILTWKSTHDFALVNGTLRLSGEDHYSALKPPRAGERCGSLAKWCSKNYAYMNVVDWKYGVYSETPDYCPIIGSANPHSRVFYIVGCNAAGQATLSYAASLMPALLGYREMSFEESESFKILNIRRFCLLPAVQEIKE